MSICYSIVSLKHTVKLEPKYLGRELREHIYERLASDKLGTVSKENGRIKAIVEIVDIESSVSNPFDGLPTFIVRYLAKIDKPIVGNSYDGTIFHVHEEGIFVDTFSFSNSEKSFQTLVVTKSNAFDMGSSVSFTVTDINYKMGKYFCIGRLNLITEGVYRR